MVPFPLLLQPASKTWYWLKQTHAFKALPTLWRLSKSLSDEGIGATNDLKERKARRRKGKQTYCQHLELAESSLNEISLTVAKLMLICCHLSLSHRKNIYELCWQGASFSLRNTCSVIEIVCVFMCRELIILVICKYYGCCVINVYIYI